MLLPKRINNKKIQKLIKKQYNLFQVNKISLVVLEWNINHLKSLLINQ